MKQFDEFMMMVKACGNDVDFDGEDGEYYLTFNDFDGFDDDWDEIMREYDNPIAVNTLGDWMNANQTHIDEVFALVYHFEDFSVQVNFTSEDI